VSKINQSAAKWQQELRSLHDEAGGAYKMLLLAPPDVVMLFGAAVADDAEALRYMRALEAFAQRTIGARRDAPLCLTCDRLLSGARAIALIGLMHGLRDDPQQCLVIGFCVACARRHGDRAGCQAAMIGALRRTVFPDLREVPGPLGAPGRA
jgi:hypothetical protein